MKKKRTTIYLPIDFIENIKKIAFQQKISLAELIRKAIASYLQLKK